MAQGDSKKRSDKFSVAPKRKPKAPKPLGPRQGRVFPPKKASKVRAERFKKALSKSIGKRIESETHQQARKEGIEFRLLGTVKTTATAKTSSSKKSKSKDKAKANK